MTIKPVILNRVKANGKTNVRLSFSHKGETSYIVTDIEVFPREFSNGRVVRHKDAFKLNSVIKDMMKKYEDKYMPIADKSMYSLKQLLSMVNNKEVVGATMQSVCADYCALLKKEDRTSYADLLDYAAKTFTRFRDIPLESLNHDVLSDFKTFMRTETNMGQVTQNATLGRLKRIVNYAIENRYVSYSVHPFADMKIQTAPSKECDIPIESIRILKDAEFPNCPAQTMARDLFLLSFSLGGINLIDLLGLDFSNGVCEYVRSKTERRSQTKVRFKMNDYTLELAKPYLKDGRLNVCNGNYKTFLTTINHRLSTISNKLNIEHISTYSARKSFSQIAFENDISEMVIDYILGHSPNSRGVMRYYAKVKPHQAELAIEKVLKLLRF